MEEYFLKEFYQTDRHIAAVILTPERRALQAWCVDKVAGKMERMDTLILDILNKRVRPLSQSSFERYCNDNAINPAIPEHAIRLSFRLSAQYSAQSSERNTNMIPAPTRHLELVM